MRYVAPNAPIVPARLPDDPALAGGDFWGLAALGAPDAWDTTTGGDGIVVGVVDSGVDYAHPDLAANVWAAPPGWDLDGCGPGTRGYRTDVTPHTCDPRDEYGHGTHLAGSIGAVGDNAVGIVMASRREPGENRGGPGFSPPFCVCPGQ